MPWVSREFWQNLGRATRAWATHFTPTQDELFWLEGEMDRLFCSREQPQERPVVQEFTTRFAVSEVVAHNLWARVTAKHELKNILAEKSRLDAKAERLARELSEVQSQRVHVQEGIDALQRRIESEWKI